LTVGYARFTLWNAIVAAKSSYACRVRDNAAHVVERTNELTDVDRAAAHCKRERPLVAF